MRFWDVGQLATEGIRQMAQEGSQTPLDGEVMAAINAGTAEHVLRGGGINPSPRATSFEFEISRSFPFVTLVAMIAPSPDWFVGVSGLSLLEGDWVAQRQVVLFPYDAGTDDGLFYTSPDLPADPRQPVSRIEGRPFLVDGQVPPVGTFTFTRIVP